MPIVCTQDHNPDLGYAFAMAPPFGAPKHPFDIFPILSLVGKITSTFHQSTESQLWCRIVELPQVCVNYKNSPFSPNLHITTGDDNIILQNLSSKD